ncbi:MAG TPA: bifunctional adenosylcobinamide kinase/adenosylcobinamide-phosphate guanylyltransferase, partial [Bryobacteraceae bacterium]|nr:bifunctional adenosylcobinamide kinase/adenosylcobinamide-phosphate guanylyltransferase [Bryobacteraceae bacterium]
MSCVLIGGGSRSGKSRFALEYARRYALPLAFIATAETRDDEMQERVAAHRADRGADFTTFEEPYDPARVIAEANGRFGAIVVDCLTLWLSNLLLADVADIARRTGELLRIGSECPSPVLLVTNEVGCGIVPENALAR